ncbi:MAG: hypothetical protein F4Y02_06940 [Chloroflexi bacterium]|nr:hypothetical protein [Chloroflexota bacterium]
MIRRSHIAVVERNAWWRGDFEVEPYEAGWALEAIGFLHVLETEGESPGIDLRVQISSDGIHWADHGAALRGSLDPGVHFVSVAHFGSWLRVVGHTTGGLKVIFSWDLK